MKPLIEKPLVPILSRRMDSDDTLYLHDEDDEKYYSLPLSKGASISMPTPYVNLSPSNPNVYVRRMDKESPRKERIKAMHTFANGSKHECPGKPIARNMLAVLIVNILDSGMSLSHKPGRGEFGEDVWGGTLKPSHKISLMLKREELD